MKIRSNGWRMVRRLVTYKDGFAFTLASGFGSGLFPVAAGTSGSIAALIVVICLHGLPILPVLGFWVLLFIAGLWGIKHLDQRFQIRDPGFVVVDEWLGMAIAAIGIPPERPALYIVAFLAFRLFDVWKPGPIRSLDQLSKNQNASAWMRGFWVIADDLAAGLLALAVTQAAIHWTKIG
ncbi:MAG: phosphatidylglycerophosphatase A [Bdellovibrionales bacterium]|nr:phosphatidylglycerophosphatase A [Bdellovibrionales bacterium]